MCISNYAPIFDYEKYELEDKNLYLRRVRPLLPNFPVEVLLQWFYDHPQQVGGHEWLDYPSLKFQISEWTTDEVPTHNYGNTGAVETYMYHFFEEGTRTSRTAKLSEYFQKHGTWPVPPIFLLNRDGVLQYPHGFPCGAPFHLLEGHHRLSLFLGYKSRIKLADKQKIYLAEKQVIKKG